MFGQTVPTFPATPDHDQLTTYLFVVLTICIASVVVAWIRTARKVRNVTSNAQGMERTHLYDRVGQVADHLERIQEQLGDLRERVTRLEEVTRSTPPAA